MPQWHDHDRDTEGTWQKYEEEPGSATDFVALLSFYMEEVKKRLACLLGSQHSSYKKERLIDVITGVFDFLDRNSCKVKNYIIRHDVNFRIEFIWQEIFCSLKKNVRIMYFCESNLHTKHFLYRRATSYVLGVVDSRYKLVFKRRHHLVYASCKFL